MLLDENASRWLSNIQKVLASGVQESKKEKDLNLVNFDHHPTMQ